MALLLDILSWLLILAGSAMVLAYETKGLLIGESASPEIVEAIGGLVATSPAVVGVNELRTLHRGPADVLLALSLDFRDDLPAGRVEDVIYELELTMKDRFPIIRRVFIEAQSKAHHDEAVRNHIKTRKA